MGEVLKLPGTATPPAILSQVDKALLPAAYEAAKAALAECANIDECKDWSDKAAALASYGRQSKDQELFDHAKRIQALFSTWCPAGTSIETLVTVEGCRWAIEDSFETAKNELGLDHNETRSWHGWYCHVSPVMLAFAMKAAILHRANTAPVQQTAPGILAGRRLSAGPFGKFPRSRKARAGVHRAGVCHRLVPLAPRSPGRSQESASQAPAENATVMLG